MTLRQLFEIPCKIFPNFLLCRCRRDQLVIAGPVTDVLVKNNQGSPTPVSHVATQSLRRGNGERQDEMKRRGVPGGVHAPHLGIRKPGRRSPPRPRRSFS